MEEQEQEEYVAIQIPQFKNRKEQLIYFIKKLITYANIYYEAYSGVKTTEDDLLKIQSIPELLLVVYAQDVHSKYAEIIESGKDATSNETKIEVISYFLAMLNWQEQTAPFLEYLKQSAHKPELDTLGSYFEYIDSLLED